MEPIGVVLFAAIMGMTSLFIIQTAATDLGVGINGDPKALDMSCKFLSSSMSPLALA